MKIISVDAKCDIGNNDLHIRENNAFRYRVFIKYDLTTNFLAIEGCNKGGMFAYLGNQFDEAIVSLYHVPFEIKHVLEKLHDKCDGFKINNDLYVVVKNYLEKELDGLEFEFSDSDKKIVEAFNHENIFK